MSFPPSDCGQPHVPSALYITGGQQPTKLDISEFLHAFDVLIGHSKSEVDEYLSRHPKLASNIRSLRSISTAEIANDLLSPPPENPSPDKVGAADRGVGASDGTSLKKNVQGLSGRSKCRVLRPRHSERPKPLASGPISYDEDSRKSIRNEKDSDAQVGQEKRKRSLTQHSDDGPKRDYVLAKAAADLLVNKLTALDTLLELQQAILQERNRVCCNAQEPLTALPKGKTASEGGVVKQLNCLQAHFEKFRPNEHIKTIADRYHAALIVQLYDHYDERKEGKYSLGVIFTETLMKAWVRDKLKNMTVRTRRRKMQTKWKAEMQKHRIWLDFNEEFGCGALSLIPKQFKNNHGLRLNRPDEKQMLLKVKGQHPNLKEDIKDLSFLMSHLLTYGTLPPKRLLLETLSEPQIREMSQKNFRGLLSFVETTASVEENESLPSPNRPPHDNEFFSEAPSALLQATEQSAAEQLSNVVNSESMGQFDELMENCIDPAVLGPNVAAQWGQNVF